MEMPMKVKTTYKSHGKVWYCLVSQKRTHLLAQQLHFSTQTRDTLVCTGKNVHGSVISIYKTLEAI
jgi:hypothetical protein